MAVMRDRKRQNVHDSTAFVFVLFCIGVVFSMPLAFLFGTVLPVAILPFAFLGFGFVLDRLLPPPKQRQTRKSSGVPSTPTSIRSIRIAIFLCPLICAPIFATTFFLFSGESKNQLQLVLFYGYLGLIVGFCPFIGFGRNFTIRQTG